ncbi:hypothetical protein [Paracandidimonas soli]|uniref:Lipoprotein n=1 Tax=Paracandidimonas soli TaxID=1917182 RepID=A0A4R3V5D0_9BURK|nr:hypothetical protein [Paracandidimonas soli]TCU98517.1 hypothetical protein EV686_105218 [Paracandidimonas soli]
MSMHGSPSRFAVAACLAMLLSACATTTRQPSTVVDAGMYDAAFKGCSPVAQDEPAVGNWLAVRKEPGIAGEIRLQIRLHADGSMHYVEQLKRGNRPPQSLDETGCWYREEGTLVLRTTHSNGSQVDAQDPIYVNRHAIAALDGKGMALNMHGKEIRLRRASPDYRLPIL